MSPACIFAVLARMGGMTVGGVRMVGSLFMASRFIVFRSLLVVPGGMLVMVGCLAVVFGSFLGHFRSPWCPPLVKLP
ncbi:MAG: hypothetical protein JO051_00110 [Acidobacteriaceae bacterium]|nr:hypothetical protein [Acidobacteriaceae bacterium]